MEDFVPRETVMRPRSIIQIILKVGKMKEINPHKAKLERFLVELENSPTGVRRRNIKNEVEYIFKGNRYLQRMYDRSFKGKL